MIKKFLSAEIPTFFFKYDTEVPFTHCSFCENSLDLYDRYAVEKVFRQHRAVGTSEIVYEYAVCWGCANEMGEEISEDSKASIAKLFTEYGQHVRNKAEYLHELELYNIDSWTERCSLTGKETRLCKEYAVSGIIENGGLVYELSPMLVSDDFMEMVQNSLSKETKDRFDGLRDKILDDAPGIDDLIFSPTPGLI